jgi:site-specific DNA-cytosine methylase
MGATDLGFTQQGFTMVHKTGTLDLGIETADANRRLLGWDWSYNFSDDPYEWQVYGDVPVIVGNPPCSFASTVTRKDLRGSDAKAAYHARAFATYVGRAKPLLASFESVQTAWTSFPEFIHELHGIVNSVSGHEYKMTLLMHNNASLGGAAQRKRLWVTWSRIPFGVEPPIPIMIPTFNESIGDLTGLDDTWEKQPYRRPETWWSSRRRAADGVVDGHKTRELMHHKRVRDIIEWSEGDWREGERLEEVVRRVHAKHGKLPESWDPVYQKLWSKNFEMGINQPMRWFGNRPCRVITGGALDQAIHPTELRTFTHREAARIQGFPDDWLLYPIRNVKRSAITYGKGVPVDAARWLAYWMKQALNGEPGTQRGEPVKYRDNVFVHDSTHNYRFAEPRDGRGHLKTR